MSPGQSFGGYVVEHAVGKGGMGAVYRARDAKLGRLVALKLMLPSEASDEESVARFLREARLAAALEHPGIVRIYEVGTVEGTPYIAMEWIEGTTLRHAKVEEPRALLRAVAEVLAFAHERGVIHRDLKPANVMVDVHGAPKLVDFGIAKRVASATFATRDGMVLGTPRYMAPEQELTSAVDARADQYAWGIIAYERLTGELPPRPAMAHAALEPRDSEVILRALAPSPQDRFPSMRGLLAAWSPKPAAVLAAPARSRSPARAFGASVFAAMTLAAVVTLAVLALSKKKPDPIVAAQPPPPSASSVEESPEEPIASASAFASASASASASAPAPVAPGPRLVQAVTLYSSAAVNIERGPLSDGLHPIIPELRRCVIGIPVRPTESKFMVRVWLSDAGIAESTTALRPGPEPLSTWPGEAARKCIDRAFVGRKFTPSGDGATFVLTFETK